MEGTIVCFYERFFIEEVEWRPNLGGIKFSQIGGENSGWLERRRW